MAAYATDGDFVAYTGQEPPADINRRLQRASDLIDERLIGAFYATDGNGNPTDANMIAALKNATCAQVEYWIETGDELGTSEQFEILQIGSVVLNRGGKSAATKSRTPPLAPRAIGELRRGGLWPVQPVAW
jgi:hypothetical protein